jgi:hypothetical protein
MEVIMEKFVSYLEENFLSPEDYILKKFKAHDVILLGEHHAIKDNLQLLINIIPRLYEAGIYNIGMEFGASEDQEALDKLVNSKDYDEEEARRLMFSYNVKWPYKEYMDVYRAAWELNKSLPENAKKFRILNLSYVYNWKDYSGRRTPYNAKKIFYKGNTEVYRAKLIENEILDKQEKLLVLTGTVHAFTRYKYPIYDGTADEFYSLQGGWLGSRLYEKYGSKVFTILLHQPFQDVDTLIFKRTSALETIEKIMKNFNNTPMGFDLLNTVMGDIRDDSYYSMTYDNFSLKDMFDGYIFIRPLTELEGCTVDYEFIKGKSYEEVTANYPDKDWSPIPSNEKEYWKIIEDFVDLKKRYFSLD